MIIQLSQLSTERYGYWLSTTPDGAGVYVLKHEGRIAYVGKTNRLNKRLLAHHVIDYAMVRRIMKGQSKLFFWPCEEPFQSILEAYMIYVFRPVMNSVQPSLKSIQADMFDTLEDIMMEAFKL